MVAIPTLGELLHRAIDDRTGAPLRDIQALVEAEEAARPRGLSLNRTTASQILRGTYHGVPSPGTIRAIGWLAGVPDHIAFAAAGQPEPGPPLANELPEGADTLSRRERAVVLDVVRTLLAHRQEADQQKSAQALALTRAVVDLERIQAIVDAAVAAGNVAGDVGEISRELAQLASTLHQITLVAVGGDENRLRQIRGQDADVRDEI